MLNLRPLWLPSSRRARPFCRERERERVERRWLAFALALKETQKKENRGGKKTVGRQCCVASLQPRRRWCWRRCSCSLRPLLPLPPSRLLPSTPSPCCLPAHGDYCPPTFVSVFPLFFFFFLEINRKRKKQKKLIRVFFLSLPSALSKKKLYRSIELSSTAANALLPDGSASYWVTPLVEAGGGQPLLPLDGTLEIRGAFPAARYFSFVSYTATGLVFDSVSDFEIPPRVAGTNPFATRGAAPGAPYSLRLVEANGTQAAAASAAGETVLLVPKGAGSVIYRIYGADPGTNATGEWRGEGFGLVGCGVWCGGFELSRLLVCSFALLSLFFLFSFFLSSPIVSNTQGANLSPLLSRRRPLFSLLSSPPSTLQVLLRPP